MAGWKKFKQGFLKAKLKIEEGIKYAKGHKAIDLVVRSALTFIPPPIGPFVQNYYEQVGGDSEQKAHQVLDILNNIYDKGEQYFNEISAKLDKLDIQIKELKDSTKRIEILEDIGKVLLVKEEKALGMLDEMSNKCDQIISHQQELRSDLADIKVSIDKGLLPNSF